MKKVFYFIITLFITNSCKEIYHPQVKSPATGYLVVEGFINSGSGPTSITLSRTTKLEDSATVIYEHNAHMMIEGDDGESYSMTEDTVGVYNAAMLHLNNNVKYRLHIFTQNGSEYISDYTSVKYTPPIDSITWAEDNGGLRIYVNAYDPQNNTKYYQWKYTETWEFHSKYYSSLKYGYDTFGLIGGVTYRFPNHNVDTTIHKCWQTLSPHNFMLGSTEKLNEDRVYLPVQYIEPASEKLSVLYSIELRQYALSHDAYQFDEIMKKNTEQLGTIFDPQPSQLKGNVHCVNDPAEMAIGFVDITEEQVKRVFISNSDIPWWGYDPHCFEVEIYVDSLGGLSSADLLPTVPLKYMGFAIKSFLAAPPHCVDCTLRGTNVKPVFWP